MPSNPTREQLIAQVNALQAQIANLPEPFVREVSGPADPDHPALKTEQAVRPLPLARDLQRMRRGSTRDATSDAAAAALISQIASLRTVLVSGVNSAGYGDKRTEFRSLTELRQILNGLEEDLADLLGTGGRVRQIRMTTQADKGL